MPGTALEPSEAIGNTPASVPFALPRNPRTWVLRVLGPLDANTRNQALELDLEGAISDATQSSPGSDLSSGMLAGTACRLPASTRLKYEPFLFDRAAHFPWNRFGEDGPIEPEDAMVIYEGMQLVMFEDGQFLLSFLASTPPTPVTLRLRFIAQTDLGSRQITIPPIRIEPDLAVDEPNQPGLWRVVHSGFAPHWKFVNPRTVERYGAARFGSIPTEMGGFGR